MAEVDSWFLTPHLTGDKQFEEELKFAHVCLPQKNFCANPNNAFSPINRRHPEIQDFRNPRLPGDCKIFQNHPWPKAAL